MKKVRSRSRDGSVESCACLPPLPLLPPPLPPPLPFLPRARPGSAQHLGRALCRIWRNSWPRGCTQRWSGRGGRSRTSSPRCQSAPRSASMPSWTLPSTTRRKVSIRDGGGRRHGARAGQCCMLFDSPGRVAAARWRCHCACPRAVHRPACPLCPPCVCAMRAASGGATEPGLSRRPARCPAPVGRMVIELFDDIAPVAVMHFRARCSGAGDVPQLTLLPALSRPRNAVQRLSGAHCAHASGLRMPVRRKQHQRGLPVSVPAALVPPCHFGSLSSVTLSAACRGRSCLQQPQPPHIAGALPCLLLPF